MVRDRERLVATKIGNHLKEISFFRKVLNVFLMPFCTSRQKPLANQMLQDIEHFDIGLSYYRGRWVITNGLYITPYTMEDVLRVIRLTFKNYPFSMRNSIVTLTLRLDYSFCPRRHIRVLFDNYVEILTAEGSLISKVEYKWKGNNIIKRVRRWFGY
jgi:hypothetical protein|nr:MAG TPA: hypothetical protein [Caudoviricetes sp.]